MLCLWKFDGYRNGDENRGGLTDRTGSKNGHRHWGMKMGYRYGYEKLGARWYMHTRWHM